MRSLSRERGSSSDVGCALSDIRDGSVHVKFLTWSLVAVWPRGRRSPLRSSGLVSAVTSLTVVAWTQLMSSDGAAETSTDVDVGHCRSSSKHAGSKTPPTPPGSPIDRPFPAATLPPPGGKTVLQMIREEGDGCRRGKSDSVTTKKSASHHSTNAGTWN